MIALGPDAAIMVAGLVAVVAVGWGANLSVRSAANGPQWAMEHLTGLRRLWPFLMGLGVVAMIVFSPIWIGLAVIYIVAALWFLSASLLRNLHRLHTLEGFIDIGVERRIEILARARRYLIGGGALLGVLGAASLAYGIIGWVAILLGGVLVATALLLTAPNA
jgi:hypothetical protein